MSGLAYKGARRRERGNTTGAAAADFRREADVSIAHECLFFSASGASFGIEETTRKKPIINGRG